MWTGGQEKDIIRKNCFWVKNQVRGSVIMKRKKGTGKRMLAGILMVAMLLESGALGTTFAQTTVPVKTNTKIQLQQNEEKLDTFDTEEVQVVSEVESQIMAATPAAVQGEDVITSTGPAVTTQPAVTEQATMTPEVKETKRPEETAQVAVTTEPAITPVATPKATKAPTVTKPTFTLRTTGKGQAIIGLKKAKGGVEGFVVSFCRGNGKYKTIGTYKNQKNFLYLSRLKVNKTYTFRVRAYKTVNGKKLYSKYATKKIKISNKSTKLVKGNYKVGSVYGPNLTQIQLNQVRNKVQYFKDHFIDDKMSDVVKVRIAHDYLCQVCSYAPDWSKNAANSAWGALVYGQAQCSGYARAMKALCDGIGIGCYYVHANSKAVNPSHQWNEVKVNGKWYIVDVQCNDSSGFYAFFLVSAKYYQSAGMRWDTNKYPKCKSNYKW